jgi:hypothetical protein
MDDLCVRIAREVEAAFPGSSIELTHEGDMTGFWDEQRVAQLRVLVGHVQERLRRADDGSERRAQFVAEHAEEQVAAVRRGRGELQQRFRQRLIHRLVEAREFFDLCGAQRR